MCVHSPFVQRGSTVAIPYLFFVADDRDERKRKSDYCRSACTQSIIVMCFLTHGHLLCERRDREKVGINPDTVHTVVVVVRACTEADRN